MRLEIEHDGAETQVELRDGIFTFGGASTDQVHLPGVSPGKLAAHIEGAQVVVESGETLEFDAVLTPPGVRRLWVPGETIALGRGVRVRRLPEPAEPRGQGTVALLQGLFDGEGQVIPPDGPCLICLTGLDLGRVFPVADGLTELGRGAKVGVRIRERSVSRRHARLRQEAGKTWIEDLGSPNGVFVSGRRLQRPRRLKHGEVIEVGAALLKFSCPAAPVAASEAKPTEEALQQPATGKLPLPAVPERSELAVLMGALLLAVVGALMTWRLTG